jgi:hypothetical protein
MSLFSWRFTLDGQKEMGGSRVVGDRYGVFLIWQNRYICHRGTYLRSAAFGYVTGPESRESIGLRRAR